MRFLKLLTGILLFISCYQSRVRPGYDSSVSAIREESRILSCEFLPYSFSSDSVRLYFKLDTRQLSYEKSGGHLECRLRFSYTVKEEHTTINRTTDSSTYYLLDIRNKIPTILMGYFHIKSPRGKNYRVRVRIQEMTSRAVMDKSFQVDISSPNAAALFLNFSEGEMPLFQPIVPGDSVKIQSHAIQNKTIRIRYYNRNFGTAPPPFAVGKLSTFSYKADSLFTGQATAQGIISFLRKGNGFYSFQCDTHQREAFSLFCFPDGYPAVKQPVQLLEPLLFICSREEYATLTGIQDTRVAVENFWIARSSSRERARQVIKQFYQRVEECNKQFTSYMEGWRTDRGMVYLIFGKPGYIQLTTYGETWTYRSGMNGESIQFSFRKIENPFSDNDYQLDRNVVYKPIWYNAVENWRMGRVFKLNHY